MFSKISSNLIIFRNFKFKYEILKKFSINDGISNMVLNAHSSAKGIFWCYIYNLLEKGPKLLNSFYLEAYGLEFLKFICWEM